MSAFEIQFDDRNLPEELKELLTGDLLRVVQEGQQKFYEKYVEVRAARPKKQKELREAFEAGTIDFRKDTAWIREGDWKVAPVPEILQNRPVELTGPANETNMVINAFNVGAIAKKVLPESDPAMPLIKYMPDGEDSSVPNLSKELQGILNVKKGLLGTLTYEKVNPDGSVKKYELGSEIAYPIYRVPGIHFDEAAMLNPANNQPIPNHLLLTCLYQYHIAPLMLQRDWVPSLYQPKLQSYEEACLVAEILAFTEQAFQLPIQSTRVTCLIETFSGAMETEEIAYGMRNYLCALNAGRWDYIFQWIQVLQSNLTPDRSRITMQSTHMEAYMDLIRDVCERRGAVFMGGMSAIIPSAQMSNEVYTKIRTDKQHEQLHGAEGAWVAHPGMVEQVLRLFTLEKHLIVPLPRRSVQAKELATLDPLLQSPEQRTEQGILGNISVGIQYLASWLHGKGCVALNNLMEDMATAEICRAQLWQWVHYEASFTSYSIEDGSLVQPLTRVIFERLYDQVAQELLSGKEGVLQVSYATAELPTAIEMFRTMVLSPALDAFIADRAYFALNKQEKDWLEDKVVQ